MFYQDQHNTGVQGIGWAHYGRAAHFREGGVGPLSIKCRLNGRSVYEVGDALVIFEFKKGSMI